MFVKIAAYTLLRHAKRTLLILFAIALSVMVMELISGLFEGMREGFFRSLTSTGSHVVIRPAGWHNRLSPYSIDYTIEDYPALLDTLRGQDPGSATGPGNATDPGIASGNIKIFENIRTAEPILTFGTLLLFGEENYTMAGHGVYPDGELFQNVREHMVEGAFLPQGRGAAISRSTAALMGIASGDMVSLLVEDSTGSPYYLTWEVTGIFDTGAEDFDNSNLFISHRNAEDLLYLEDAATEIRIRLDSPDHAQLFARTTGSLLGSRYEVIPWQETEGSIVTMLEAMDIMILMMNLMIVIVAASVITNALLMNIFDRIAEFGTLRAIGMKKRQLVSMIMAEGLLQGVGGSLLGLMVGLPLVLWLSGRGLDFGAVTESFGIGSSLFYFSWKPLHSLVNAAAGTLIALAGSLYAARAASRMTILENLAEA
jgi:putative ABC transport system permease protein